MYHFTSSFLADHSTGRRLTDVDIVSGDGFFNRQIVIDLGFTNACVDLLQGILVNVIQAQSEAQFD